jgi:hypothetical protein
MHKRDLVEHASPSPRRAVGDNQPKRTGWWARARATLTGDTGR